MGSLDGCGKCGNTVLTFGYFVHDETGEVLPEISCFKCGWRLIPPPKCTEPMREDVAEPKASGPARKPHRLHLRGGLAPGEYASGARTGECRNCGRFMWLVARNLCRFCYDRRDRLDEARAIVEGGNVYQERSDRLARAKRNALSEVRCG